MVQNEKLTAEDRAEKILEICEEYWSTPAGPSYESVLVEYENLRSDVITEIEQHVEHATAELRKEIKAAETKVHDLGCHVGSGTRAYEQLRTWCDHVETQLAEAQRQRDEAVKALEAIQRIKQLVQYPDTIGIEFTDEARAVSAAMDKVDFVLSRLSSGETRPKCDTCGDKGMIGHMTIEGGESWPCPDCS